MKKEVRKEGKGTKEGELKDKKEKRCRNEREKKKT